MSSDRTGLHDKTEGPRAGSAGMGRASIVWLIVLVAFLSVWVCSTGHCDDVDQLVERALRRSGLQSQAKTLIPAIVGAFPGDAFSDASLRGKIRTRINKSFGETQILETVRESLKSKFDQSKMDHVLEFYDSKLGKKIGELQAGALLATSLSQVKESKASLALMQDSRMPLLRRIVQATEVAVAQERLFNSMIRGLLESGDAQEGQPAAVRSRLRSFTDRAMAPGAIFEQMAIASLSRTFASLSDKELEELAAFEESDAARWFRSATLPGLEKAVYEISRLLGLAIRESKPPTEHESR